MLTACLGAFYGYEATAYKVKKDSMIAVKTFSSDATIGPADKDIIKAKTQGESVMNMTGVTKPARLNHVVHVSNIEHSLISVSSLCDNSHAVEFGNINCVVKKEGNVIVIGGRKGRMYLVKLPRTWERAMRTPVISGRCYVFGTCDLRMTKERLLNE